MRERFLAIIHRIPELTRYVQIGLAVIIISFLFPNPSGFNYNFDENTLWRFDDLVAPFDFAIQKPASQYELP